MDVTKGYAMTVLNIFLQVFFLQQIFFGINVTSGSQVVGQHEPDVEKKGHKSLEGRLVDRLLSNYSSDGRPVSNASEAVSVSIGMYLSKLLDLDERRQLLYQFGWLEVIWRDKYLMWLPSDYDGLDRVIMSPMKVWLPDFGIENSAERIYDDLHFKQFRVTVMADGTVIWHPGGKFVTSCMLDVTLYPFDTQECSIEFVNWAYDGRQQLLVNGTPGIGLDAYRGDGEWKVLGTNAVTINQFYDAFPDIPYPTVKFTIFMRRKPLYYVMNIMLPCLMLSLLDLLVFCLPPESGEKVSLGITVLLSFSVFLLVIADNVPQTSETAPLLGVYLTVVMTTTAGSLIATVGVIYLHHEYPRKHVPLWLRRMCRICLSSDSSSRLAQVWGSKRESRRPKSEVETRLLNPGAGAGPNFNSNFERWDSVFQRTSVSAANPGRRDSPLCNHSNSTKDTNHTSDNLAGNVAVAMEDAASSLCLKDATLVMTMRELCKNIKKLREKYDDEEEIENYKEEWRVVVKFMDRCCLFLFSVLLLLCAVTILYVYPAYTTGDPTWNVGL